MIGSLRFHTQRMCLFSIFLITGRASLHHGPCHLSPGIMFSSWACTVPVQPCMHSPEMLLCATVSWARAC